VPSEHRPWIDAISESNARLEVVLGTTGGVTAAQATYCPGWSVADILRHLGSGAEIGLLNLSAALRGQEPPPRQRYGEIIELWGEKAEANLAEEAVSVNDNYVRILAALDDDALDALRVRLRGRDLNVSAFAGRRLFEHALHTWDIAIMRDPLATLSPMAAALLVDRVLGNLDMLASGPKPTTAPFSIAVSVSDVGHAFVLKVAPDVVAVESGTDSDATLDISADAFVRLLSGRLDAAHTFPALAASSPTGLGQLRTVFAGVPSPTEPA
jgi:uncharacterized protein (TIGR03083 family)